MQNARGTDQRPNISKWWGIAASIRAAGGAGSHNMVPWALSGLCPAKGCGETKIAAFGGYGPYFETLDIVYVNNAWLDSAKPVPNKIPTKTSLRKCIPSRIREAAILRAQNSRAGSKAS
jgi:hypothetical protein